MISAPFPAAPCSHNAADEIWACLQGKMADAGPTQAAVSSGDGGDAHPALPVKKTLLLVNNFVVHTTQFLNHFSALAEEKLQRVQNNIVTLEESLVMLESRLARMPELADIKADPVADENVGAPAAQASAQPPPAVEATPAPEATPAAPAVEEEAAPAGTWRRHVPRCALCRCVG